MKILKNLLGNNYNTKIDIDEIARVVNGKVELLGNLVDTESGSNSNGTFIKFPDGTMICHVFITNNYPVSLSSWGGYYRTFITDDFAANFISPPTVLLIGKPARDFSMRMHNLVINDISTSSVRYVMLVDDPSTNNVNERGHIAIGKWK